MERAVDDADERDDAAVLVVRRVEDERARRRVAIALRRRDPLDDRVEHVLDADARLRRDAEHAVGVVAEQVASCCADAVGVGLRQVDLVDDRDDLEVVVDREVGVRDRLRLDPLRRVDDEQRALARLQRARHLVGEVDVAGRVDQVQLVALPRDAHGLRLDRDPALALEVHRVEHLRAHLALRDGVRQLEDAVGERRLAVVDVRDDREVADVALVHGLTGDGSRRAIVARTREIDPDRRARGSATRRSRDGGGDREPRQRIRPGWHGRHRRRRDRVRADRAAAATRSTSPQPPGDRR